MSRKKVIYSPDFASLSAWGKVGEPFFGIIDFDGNLLAAPIKKSGCGAQGRVLDGRIATESGAIAFKFRTTPPSAPLLGKEGSFDLKALPLLRAVGSHPRRSRAKPGEGYAPGAERIRLINPPDREKVINYIKALQGELGDGFSYLVNYCSQSEVSVTESAQSLFDQSAAPFTVWLEDHFISFSPEAFVTVQGNTITTTPMKGTGFDAGRLMADAKEQAEHATVVDLLRNDLGRVAKNIQVGDYRYLTEISQAGNRTLYQTSTRITGAMPADWRATMGEWLPQLLPAGSITGAPKKKTIELIRKYETEPRGFFTGVAVLFDGENLMSSVLIRYLDLTTSPLKFRSGAGITIYSDPAEEYQEILNKVYIPV